MTSSAGCLCEDITFVAYSVIELDCVDDAVARDHCDVRLVNSEAGVIRSERTNEHAGILCELRDARIVRNRKSRKAVVASPCPGQQCPKAKISENTSSINQLIDSKHSHTNFAGRWNASVSFMANTWIVAWSFLSETASSRLLSRLNAILPGKVSDSVTSHDAHTI